MWLKSLHVHFSSQHTSREKSVILLTEHRSLNWKRSLFRCIYLLYLKPQIALGWFTVYYNWQCSWSNLGLWSNSMSNAISSYPNENPGFIFGPFSRLSLASKHRPLGRNVNWPSWSRGCYNTTRNGKMCSDNMERKDRSHLCWILSPMTCSEAQCRTSQVCISDLAGEAPLQRLGLY